MVENLPRSVIVQMAKSGKTPICPRCGREAVESTSQYGKRHDCCGLWSYQCKPLVDRWTHQARINAHNAFDVIWKSGLMTRSEAYAWLAEKLGVEEDYAHMSGMTQERAERVQQICYEYLASAPVQQGGQG